MARPLPSAPDEHDHRNQNETRRTIMRMLDELRRRMDNVRAVLESD